jgi:hypothetical protein
MENSEHCAAGLKSLDAFELNNVIKKFDEITGIDESRILFGYSEEEDPKDHEDYNKYSKVLDSIGANHIRGNIIIRTNKKNNKESLLWTEDKKWNVVNLEKNKIKEIDFGNYKGKDKQKNKVLIEHDGGCPMGAMVRSDAFLLDKKLELDKYDFPNKLFKRCNREALENLDVEDDLRNELGCEPLKEFEKFADKNSTELKLQKGEEKEFLKIEKIKNYLEQRYPNNKDEELKLITGSTAKKLYNSYSKLADVVNWIEKYLDHDGNSTNKEDIKNGKLYKLAIQQKDLPSEKNWKNFIKKNKKYITTKYTSLRQNFTIEELVKKIFDKTGMIPTKSQLSWIGRIMQTQDPDCKYVEPIPAVFGSGKTESIKFAAALFDKTNFHIISPLAHKQEDKSNIIYHQKNRSTKEVNIDNESTAPLVVIKDEYHVYPTDMKVKINDNEVKCANMSGTPIALKSIIECDKKYNTSIFSEECKEEVNNIIKDRKEQGELTKKQINLIQKSVFKSDNGFFSLAQDVENRFDQIKELSTYSKLDKFFVVYPNLEDGHEVFKFLAKSLQSKLHKSQKILYKDNKGETVTIEGKKEDDSMEENKKPSVIMLYDQSNCQGGDYGNDSFVQITEKAHVHIDLGVFSKSEKESKDLSESYDYITHKHCLGRPRRTSVNKNITYSEQFDFSLEEIGNLRKDRESTNLEFADLKINRFNNLIKEACKKQCEEHHNFIKKVIIPQFDESSLTEELKGAFTDVTELFSNEQQQKPSGTKNVIALWEEYEKALNAINQGLSKTAKQPSGNHAPKPLSKTVKKPSDNQVGDSESLNNSKVDHKLNPEPVPEVDQHDAHFRDEVKKMLTKSGIKNDISKAEIITFQEQHITGKTTIDLPNRTFQRYDKTLHQWDEAEQHIKGVVADKITDVQIDDKKVGVQPQPKRNDNIISLVEDGEQIQQYAGQRNYYTQQTIKNNNQDTIFVFGANDRHIKNRSLGGSGQASATKDQKNVFPIVTTNYGNISNEKLTKHQEGTRAIAEQFVENGGKVVFPMKYATEGDVTLLKSEGYEKNIETGDLVVNVGTGIAGQNYIEGSRKFAQELYNDLRKTKKITSHSMTSTMQKFHDNMDTLEKNVREQKATTTNQIPNSEISNPQVVDLEQHLKQKRLKLETNEKCEAYSKRLNQRVKTEAKPALYSGIGAEVESVLDSNGKNITGFKIVKVLDRGIAKDVERKEGNTIQGNTITLSKPIQKEGNKEFIERGEILNTELEKVIEQIRNLDLQSFKENDIVKKLQKSISDQTNKEKNFFHNKKQISFSDIKSASEVQITRQL